LPSPDTALLGHHHQEAPVPRRHAHARNKPDEPSGQGVSRLLERLQWEWAARLERQRERDERREAQRPDDQT
jgi:hypothetical protein